MIGRSEASYIKHRWIYDLALAQANLAIHSILKNGGRALVFDMHAGDAKGVEILHGQMVLPIFQQESLTTAQSALLVGGLLRETRKADIECDLWLAERSIKSRKELLSQVVRYQCEVLRNHCKYPQFDTGRYQWGLIFNDPNGPSDHSIEILKTLAVKIPSADFIVVVNEGAIEGELAVNTVNLRSLPWLRSVGSIERQHEKHRWMLDAVKWAELLGRRKLLRSRETFASGGRMIGRILLISNFPHRASREFELIDVTRLKGVA